MDSSVEARLQEIFDEYESLLRVGEYYGAVLRLALISSCLPNLDDELSKEWTNRLKKELLAQDVIKAAEAGIRRDEQKIRKILAIGTRWNDDEILLVLSDREGMEMVANYLKKRCLREVELRVEDIDEQIAQLSSSRENKRAFKRAADLMRKNADLPISRQWLDHMSERSGK